MMNILNIILIFSAPSHKQTDELLHIVCSKQGECVDAHPLSCLPPQKRYIPNNLKNMFVGTGLDLSTNIFRIILTYIIYLFSSITQSIRGVAASIVIINRVADAHLIDCPLPLLLRLIQRICSLSFLFVMRGVMIYESN